MVTFQKPYNIEISKLNFQLMQNDRLPYLQDLVDESEKLKNNAFSYFSDTDMLIWYLYQSKHLDKTHGRSLRTINEYRRELEQFINFFMQYHHEMNVYIEDVVEGSLFKSLLPQHMRKYQEWLATKSPYALKNGAYAHSTIERKTTILKSFFSFLQRVDYIKEPLAQGFKIANTRKEERPNRDLGPNAVVDLLDGFWKEQHYVMFTIVHVLTTTGIRNEEFCTLKVKDIRENTILGGYTLKVIGKGNKEREIPLKKKVLESIELFRKVRGLSPLKTASREDPLFTTNRKKAYKPNYLSTYVSKEISTLYKASGEEAIKITPHYFRHAFAIISRINNVDVYSIMRSLGHEHLKTTEIYLEKVFATENHAIHSWKPELFGEYI